MLLRAQLDGSEKARHFWRIVRIGTRICLASRRSRAHSSADALGLYAHSDQPNSQTVESRQLLLNTRDSELQNSHQYLREKIKNIPSRARDVNELRVVCP